MLLYCLLLSAYYALSSSNTIKEGNECGICSYINNTEYRFITPFKINQPFFTEIAIKLGPEWMGHRMCCIDDLEQDQYDILTYNNEVKTIQSTKNQFNKTRRSLDTHSVMECLFNVGVLYSTISILAEYLKLKYYCNECNTYDFTSSKTITKLYSDPKYGETVVKFDEKLCSQDLKYCAVIENYNFIVRKNNKYNSPFKNTDKAIRLNQNGGMELFYLNNSTNVIWENKPRIKGQAPYTLFVSDIGTLKVIDHNNKVAYESDTI